MTEKNQGFADLVSESVSFDQLSKINADMADSWVKKTWSSIHLIL